MGDGAKKEERPVRNSFDAISGSWPHIRLFVYSDCSILLTAGVGMWLHRIQGGRQLQRGLWTAGLGILFFALAVCVGGESLKGIEHFRKESARQIRDMRFGEDSLPEGNMYRRILCLTG